jgi:hypothetical protein
VQRIKTAVVQRRLAADPYTSPIPAGLSGPGKPATGKAKGKLQSVSIWIQRSAGPFVDSVAVPARMNSHGTRRNHTRTANMNTVALAEEGKTGNNTTCASPAPIQHFTIARV